MNPPSVLKAVAFDLDGTLVDSLPGLASAVDQVMAELALPQPGQARVSGWIGNGADRLLQRAIEWAVGESKNYDGQQVRQCFNLHYAESMRKGTLLYPGVVETLQALSQQGVMLGVVTNKPTPFVMPLLQELGIEHFFQVVIGGDDVKVKKPHPAPLYSMLAQLGLHARELLFVGDSRNDVLAAQAAGCPVVGMTYGYNYGEPIADSLPSYVIDTFAQLLPIVTDLRTD